MPERARGTVLAFDFGLKRIGVAVGERELGTSHPLGTVHGLGEIEKLVHAWQPARLVVGLPVAEHGAHPLAKRIERFARQLAGRTRLPVALVDERFTSAEAESRLKQAGTKAPLKKNVDALAAQLILEQYFGSEAA